MVTQPKTSVRKYLVWTAAITLGCSVRLLFLTVGHNRVQQWRGLDVLSQHFVSDAHTLNTLVVRSESEYERFLNRSEGASKAFNYAVPFDRIKHPRIGQYPLNSPDAAPSSLLDVNHYIVSGSGLGVQLKRPDAIIAGHLLLPPIFLQSHAQDDELLPCVAGVVCSFSIQSCDAQGVAVEHGDAHFHVRLFGDAIIGANVTYRGQGKYAVEYVSNHPGQYLVEVYLDIVEGGGSPPEYVVHGTPFLLDKVIYRSEHILSVTPTGHNGLTSETATSLCTTSAQQDGRWVYLPEGKCQQPYCTGSTLEEAQISDPLGLNLDYVWAPYSCHFHIYSPVELYQCIKGCNYHTWGIAGDSIGREMLQNVQMMLSNFDPQVSMPKLKAADTYDNTFVSTDAGMDPVSVKMLWYRSEDSVVAVEQFQAPHLLSTGQPVSEMIANLKVSMDAFSKWCNANPTRKCYYYVNPAVQREADHVQWRNGNSSFYNSITDTRMQALNAAGREHARSLGLHMLEGEEPTRHHWNGCWDGLHYSEMYHHYVRGDPRWFGGVSMMITQVLINDLCNKDCNSNYKHF